MITITDTLGTAGTITADQYDVAAWLVKNFEGDQTVADFAQQIENGNIDEVAEDLAAYAGVEIA